MPLFDSQHAKACHDFLAVVISVAILYEPSMSLSRLLSLTALFCLGSALLRADTVTEAWVHRYNGPSRTAQDHAVKVLRDVRGDLIVVGYTDNGASGEDVFVIKYCAQGQFVWVQRYNGPANRDDRPEAAALDTRGNVAITARSQNAVGRWESYTAKAQVWLVSPKELLEAEECRGKFEDGLWP
jgi:hypothetical protein